VELSPEPDNVDNNVDDNVEDVRKVISSVVEVKFG
jgi:hypothetical protein